MAEQLEIGDWVRFPSLKFEGPHRYGRVDVINNFGSGTERCEIFVKKDRGGNKQYLSYPACNVDKLTKEEAVLRAFEQ
jgi:hypothetical protein